MTEFYYVLDKTYKKGTFSKVKEALKQGKSINQYLNDKPTSIYIATTHQGKYMKQNVGIKILARHWDNKNQKVKKSHHDYSQLNLLLKDMNVRLERTFRDERLKRKIINPYDIKEMMYNVINGKSINSKNVAFFSAFQEFIKEKTDFYKPSTIEKYNIVFNLLKEFEEKIQPIYFENINKDFETKLRTYSLVNKNHLNNTVAKTFRTLKAFLSWSYEKEYTDNKYYQKFNVKEDAIEVVYLTSEELKKLETLDLEPYSRLDKVRDVFLFQLYTGQRYSDIQNLRYKDIDQKNDTSFWNNYQLKGKKSIMVRIPLSKKAIVIYNKYKNKYKILEDKVLPAPSNVKINVYIKEICKMAGINDMFTMIHYRGKQRIERVQPKYKFISTHSARKSYVVLSLEKGMSKSSLMKITGHTDEKAMRPYIKITEEFYTSEFNKAWD